MPEVTKNTPKKSANKECTSKIWHIVQNARNPVTGEELLCEEAIKLGLESKSIDKYAYILHDKDVYDEQAIENFKGLILKLETDLDKAEADEDKEKINASLRYYRSLKVGDPKPPHWHIALQLNNTISAKNVAKWFDVPEQCAEAGYKNVKDTRWIFKGILTYLVHEGPKARHKYHYEDSEVRSNFDFRKAVNSYLTHIKASEVTVDNLIEDILNGSTLTDIYNEYPVLFIKYKTQLEAARDTYLSKQPMPKYRFNMFIAGKGGSGKSVVSEILGKILGQFVSEKFSLGLTDTEDLIFRTGSQKVAFNDYRSQPVIIWDDKRGYDLKKSTTAQSDILNILDLRPKKMNQNTKGNKTTLRNYISIINADQHPQDFANDLIPKKVEKSDDDHLIYSDRLESRNQVDRRLNCYMIIGEYSYDVYLHSDIVTGKNIGDKDTTVYSHIANIPGIFNDICRIYEGHPDLIEEKITENLRPLLNSIIPFLQKKYDAVMKPVNELDEEYEKAKQIALLKIKNQSSTPYEDPMTMNRFNVDRKTLRLIAAQEVYDKALEMEVPLTDEEETIMDSSLVNKTGFLNYIAPPPKMIIKEIIDEAFGSGPVQLALNLDNEPFKNPFDEVVCV